MMFTVAAKIDRVSASRARTLNGFRESNSQGFRGIHPGLNEYVHDAEVRFEKSLSEAIERF